MSSVNMRILLVEDDNDIRLAMTELLLDTGYEVIGAAHGLEALDILAGDSRFDLILLDLTMPFMDGIEFRNRQLKDERISEIPVIVMSADGQVNEEMKRSGVSAYVKKPMDLTSFLAIVGRFLT